MKITRSIFLILMAVLLCAPAWAAVTPLDAAASSGTAGTATTLAYTVSSGTNRYLVSAYLQDNDGGQPSATYGTVAGALLRTCDTGDGNLRLTIYGWDEADIAAAANTTIAWSVDDNLNQIMARSYKGVDQAAPVPETDCDFVLDGSNNPFTTSSIAAGDGSYVFSAQAAGTARLVTWANITELLDETTSSSGLTIADVAVPTGGTINPQPTTAEPSVPRRTLISLELAPAVTGNAPTFSAVIGGGDPGWPGRYEIQSIPLPGDGDTDAK